MRSDQFGLLKITTSNNSSGEGPLLSEINYMLMVVVGSEKMLRRRHIKVKIRN